MRIVFVKYLFTLCVAIFLGTNFAHAQTDSVKVEKKANKKAIYGNARKTTLMSVFLPGLGQVYNRKYWKVPVIYAGLGGFGYLLATNQKKFAYYRDNLKYENDNDSNTINVTDPKLGSDQLLSEKNRYRKYRDLGIIGCTIVYVLNIIDANVDAHLKTFDVSDDLSMKITPYNHIGITNASNICWQGGLTIQLNFK